MVVRDIALYELTGAAVHYCHMSTAESIEAIRQAKKRGANVSCETAPHYFTLNDESVLDYDANFKMNPPPCGLKMTEKRSLKSLWTAQLI